MIRRLLDRLRGRERFERSQNWLAQAIMMDVAAHPEYAPTLEELQFLSPDSEHEEVEETVEWLVGNGLLQRITATGPEGEVVTIVAFTEEGVERVEVSWVDIESLRESYAELEFSARHERLEAIPRPPMREYYGCAVPDLE